MPSFPSKPLVRPRDDGLQLSYQLPHRVYTAKSYPILAPNGSSIVIYGYENGLKVVWRGGRHFAERQTAVEKEDKPQKANRASDDAVMIIDSDEESVPESPKEDAEPSYHFESEDSEVDPANPYESVFRQVDIPLGSRVLDLAVPRILPEPARSSLDPFPPILKKLMVVAVVCADYSTRIVTVPLTPPYTQSQASSLGTQILSIGGGVTHQEFPRGVSVTFTYQEADQQEDTDMTRSRSSSSKLSAGGTGRWDLLVATHSAESSGLLVLHRAPVVEEKEGSYWIDEEDIETKRRYLPAPAQNIAFNPSPYPSPRHSTLLVSFHSGCVKIYSCFSTKRSKSSRRTSSSNDFETSETDGKWLISLYPGFEESPSGVTRRKTIVNAEWVLGGRAVMVLMADGEWGVWDIEGAGPGTSKGPLHRQASIEGVSGGSLTTFSVSGRILRPLLQGQDTETAGPGVVEQRPKFAPLTPSTKRLREDSLLKGSRVSPPSPSLCGEISVYQTNSFRDPLPDESILLRHGDHSAIIPSLLSLWRNAVRTSGTFDASNRCRVSALQDITLMGEHLKGITHLPAASRTNRESAGQKFDIMLTTEHRIMIVAPRLSEPAEAPSSFRQSANEAPTAETDQLMLQRGELDVTGMDRLLSGMASANRSIGMGSPIKRARIFT